MKKVWILEKFISNEEMKRDIAFYEECAEKHRQNGTEEAVAGAEELIAMYQKKLEENPNGYWLGWQGKVIYSQFCECAKESIARDREATYRVVTAEIDDNAKYWSGYKNPVENAGVCRYLMATV